jgi:hypothetical protein
MQQLSKIWGVKATVFLKYEKGIKDLAKKLTTEMQLPEVVIDTDQDYPHEIFGTCEFMGFEIWIKKSTKYEGFSFVLELETMLYLDLGIDKNDRHDISPWLAEFISRISDIDSRISDPSCP